MGTLYFPQLLKINFITFFKKGSKQVYENMIGNLKRGNKMSMNFVVTL